MKALRLMELVAVCVIGSPVSAQDLIVKKDGTVIQAVVSKVGTSEIEYKKWSNQEGPQYSIAITDILAINYKNGEKETFENVTNGNGQTTKEGIAEPQDIIQVKLENLSIEAKTANDALIAKINEPVELLIREKDKKDVGKREANSAVACFGASSNSILCNEDIEICVETGKFYKENSKRPAQWEKGGVVSYDSRGGYIRGILNPAIQFVVTNKSSHTVYIDLVNTFYVNMGQSQTFYVPSSTTTSKTSSSGAGVNLGSVTGALGIGGVAGNLANGVNVGGESSTTTTNTTYSQRIIALAPMSSISLPPQYFLGNEPKKIMKGFYYGLWKFTYSYLYCAYINFSPESQGNQMMLGDHYVYTESNSPINFSFFLTYSKVENGTGAKSLSSKFYLKDLFGRIGGRGELTNDAIPSFGFCVTNDKGDSFPKP